MITFASRRAGEASERAKQAGDSALAWDTHSLCTALEAAYPSADWLSVYEVLDCPEFYVPDDEGCGCLLTLWQLLSNSDAFPLRLFAEKPWRNVAGQLSFLRFAVWRVRACLELWRAGVDQPPHMSIHSVCSWRVLLLYGAVSAQ